MESIKRSQRGFSLLLFFFVAAAAIFAVVVALKLVPAYLNNSTINHILKTIANDPAMQNATDYQIKQSYNKRVSVEGVTNLSAEEIEINNENGKLSLSSNYSVKIPLVANITLLLDFNASSS